VGTNADPVALPPTRYRLFVLAVLCSLAFLTYLDRICIMRAQGDIARDLRFAELTEADEQWLRERGLQADPQARAKLGKDRATTRMSWVFSAFVFGYLLFEVPAGWLGDRWGARSVIVRIVLWWSLFTALTGGVKEITRLFWANPGPAQWLIVIVAVRFLFGAGEAGAYPNIARALGRWFPFRERATAQSFIWLSSRLGGAFAPIIIGSLMVLSGGWQPAFWILGVCGIAWATFFLVWFRDRPEDKPQVNPAERDLIRGGASVPGSIYDDSSAAPMRWTSLFSPNVLALCVVSFSVSFCFYFYITFLPQYLKDQFNVDYQQSQVITGLPLLLGGFACLAGGFLSDYAIRKTGNKRWGRSVIPIIAWSLAAFCAFAVPQFNSAFAVMTLLVIGFIFQDLGVPSMWSLPADLGGRFAGTLGGWMNSAGCVGGMLSPLVAAKMSIAYGWNSTFIVFGAIYLLGAFAWLRVDASTPMRHTHTRSTEGTFG
jgi:ACS family glucarate transporter-like MFS transporter